MHRVPKAWNGKIENYVLNLENIFVVEIRSFVLKLVMTGRELGWEDYAKMWYVHNFHFESCVWSLRRNNYLHIWYDKPRMGSTSINAKCHTKELVRNLQSEKKHETMHATFFLCMQHWCIRFNL